MDNSTVEVHAMERSTVAVYDKVLAMERRVVAIKDLSTIFTIF